MKTLKLFSLISVLVILGFVFYGCDNESTSGNKNNSGNTTTQDHKGTIKAFDTTINVVGDGSISAADFVAALGKLQDAMTLIDEVPLIDTARALFVNMVEREGFAILIGTGNAAPDADANKSMIIGIDYLLENDVNVIYHGIAGKVLGAAFE